VAPIHTQVREDADDIVIGQTISCDYVPSRTVAFLKQVVEIGAAGKIIERLGAQRQGHRDCPAIGQAEIG
jgi:hypothetical protein